MNRLCIIRKQYCNDRNQTIDAVCYYRDKEDMKNDLEVLFQDAFVLKHKNAYKIYHDWLFRKWYKVELIYIGTYYSDMKRLYLFDEAYEMVSKIDNIVKELTTVNYDNLK